MTPADYFNCNALQLSLQNRNKNQICFFFFYRMGLILFVALTTHIVSGYSEITFLENQSIYTHGIYSFSEIIKLTKKRIV